MNQLDELTAQRIEVATEYFLRVDAGAPTLLDLLTDDIQLHVQSSVWATESRLPTKPPPAS